MYGLSTYMKGEKWPHELGEMYVGKYSHPMEHLGRQMQRPILWVRKRSRWWFQIFLIFTPTWGNDPF